MVFKIPVTSLYNDGIQYYGLSHIDGKGDKQKTVAAHLRLIAWTIPELETALSVAEKNGYVIAIDYAGELVPELSEILARPRRVSVLRKISMEYMEGYEENIPYNIQKISDAVDALVNQGFLFSRIIVEVSAEFADMYVVDAICKKYKNVRFCGGKLFRFEGCNLGCVVAEDIRGRRGEKGDMFVNVCACAVKYADIETVSCELIPAEEIQKLVAITTSSAPKKSGNTSKSSSSSGKPKKVASLFNVGGGLDDF